MKRKKTWPMVWASFASFVAMSATSQGQLADGDTIGIDFGATPSTDPGNTWNNLSVGGSATTLGLADADSVVLSAGSLVTTANTAVSGVSFTLENSSGQIAWDFGGGTEGSAGLVADATVYGDGVISNDAGARPVDALTDTLVLTFSGLDNSLVYSLEGGWDNNNANFEAIWSADGQSFQTDPNGAANAGYGVLNGLTTDGSGNLVVTVTGSNNNAAAHITVGAVTLTAFSVPVWQLDGSGNWSTAANWTTPVPNAPSAEAIFNDSIPLTGPLTASLDIPVTLGSLNFFSIHPVTIGGPSALTLNGGGAASISSLSGSHEISADVVLVDPVEVNFSSGTVLEMSGALSGSGSVTNASDAQLILSGDLSAHTGGVVSNGGSLVVSGTDSSDITVTAGSLEMSGTGVGNISVDAGVTFTGEGSHTGSLNLAADSILSVDPTNGVAAFTTGTLSPAGEVNLDFSSNPIGLGTFTVLNYTTSYAGTAADDFVSDFRLTLADTGSSITGSVAASETTTWTGAVDGGGGFFFWNNGVSANWTSSDSLFYAGDSVTFTDTGSGFVDLDSAVAPATVTFTNNSGSDYSFEDTSTNVESISATTGGINVTGDGDVFINAKITGNTDIVHSGAGILSIGGGGVSNDFVGTITVDGGGILQNGGTAPNNLTSLGDFGNTFSFTNGSTFDIAGGANLDRGYKGYGTGSFVFGAGTTLTNTSGTTKRNAFDDEVVFDGDITIAGTGRIDFDGDIGITGTNIVVTFDNEVGSVLGTSNTGKSIAEWVVNDGTLFASSDTSFGDAPITVNFDGAITGNVGAANDIGNGPGVANIANAITLNGGQLKANQSGTTSIYSGTVTVADQSRIDPDRFDRTVILSGILTESGPGGDLTIGDGTTRFASTLDATGFTGDLIINQTGSFELENAMVLTQNIIVDDAGDNKQVRLTPGNSAEISGGISLLETGEGNFDLNVQDASDTLTVSGDISGSGGAGVAMTGPGKVILSGTNTYSGPTTVADGSLCVTALAALPAGGDVEIVAPGVLNLDYVGSITIGQLTIDGVVQPIGAIDSSHSSGAITGGGSLNVTATDAPLEIVDITIDGSGDVVLTTSEAAAGLTVQRMDDETLGTFADVPEATVSGANEFTISDADDDPDANGKELYRVTRP